MSRRVIIWVVGPEPSIKENEPGVTVISLSDCTTGMSDIRRCFSDSGSTMNDSRTTLL